MDGHHSHVLNAQLLKLCIDFNLQKSGKEVQLVCFPTGQTDKLQPLDNCPFGSMKPKWIAYKDDSRIDPYFQVVRDEFGIPDKLNELNFFEIPGYEKRFSLPSQPAV